MYRLPSRKKIAKEVEKPNLIPILDAVFIFIFFLLLSANFNKVFQINSEAPIISNAPYKEKDNKPPLALSLRIEEKAIIVMTGVPSKVRQKFLYNEERGHDLEGLNTLLVSLKKQFPDESTAIFEMMADLPYETLVKIMDATRMTAPTSEAIYTKDADGIDIKTDTLFDKIIFGNIQS